MTGHYYYERPWHSGYLNSYGSYGTSLLPYTSSVRSTYMPHSSCWSTYHPSIYSSYPRVSIYSVTSTPRALTYHTAIPKIAHHRLWDATASPMVSTRERLLRYSALYGDDDDVEAILTQGQKYNPVSSLESTFSNTIQDIEDDIRNWRYAASSVLNRFTTGKPSNVELSTLANRYSSDYGSGNNNYWRNNYSSYYRPSTLKSLEYSTYKAPIYDSGRSMYVSSRSKHWDSPKSTFGDMESRSYTGHYPQSKRSVPKFSEHDSKIKRGISFLSHYILPKNE
ncbi:uncharacterized protein LOC130698441 [Daphnia carinata]|uniref:uncharacterized protein LOC130698441 n=1 Tax=Daphnia carinata TaxID=120202 RepID=UPI00258071A7|nr:uncharacterized protein LOC130698441 [Daphnia carinata]